MDVALDCLEDYYFRINFVLQSSGAFQEDK